MSSARALELAGPAANCNGVSWGSWRWTPHRVVAVLVCVGLIAEAHDGRSREGLRLVAWVLVGHGVEAAARLLSVMEPRSVGGIDAEHLARVALRAVGAVDWARASRLGRVELVPRERVLRAAWRVLRAAGVPRELAARELGELVRVWSPRDGAAQVEGWVSSWR